MQSRVGVIVGSLRKGAHTRMLARALPELTPPSLQLVDIGIGELPLYNYDLETRRRRRRGPPSEPRSSRWTRSCS